MSGLDTMAMRLKYYGGNKQVDRMNEDKLRSLKKALLYSYQSATARLSDGREFRCLINPDQIKNTYDNKYISIPFKDICLNEKEINADSKNKNKKTSEGLQEIGMKPGDVFTWKENNTDWLVYLRRFEETAYFRAEIRRCKYVVTIDQTEYKCYVARPSVNEIDWRHQDEKLWNELDYTLQMYITKDEKTEAFFHRFSKIKINGKPWEVQSMDNMSSDGIIILYLKEWYQNSIEQAKEEEDIKTTANVTSVVNNNEPLIDGPISVYPYDKKTYTIKNAENGTWVIGSSKAKILEQDETKAYVEIVTGRSGKFELKYVRENEDDIVLNINIQSL